MTHSEVLPTLVGIRIPNVHSILLPFTSLLAVPTAVEFTKSATPRALIFINAKGPQLKWRSSLGVMTDFT